MSWEAYDRDGGVLQIKERKYVDGQLRYIAVDGVCYREPGSGFKGLVPCGCVDEDGEPVDYIDDDEETLDSFDSDLPPAA